MQAKALWQQPRREMVCVHWLPDLSPFPANPAAWDVTFSFPLCMPGSGSAQGSSNRNWGVSKRTGNTGWRGTECMNVHAVMPVPNLPRRRSSGDGCPGVAVRDQPQGMWAQLYLCHWIAAWPWESRMLQATKVLMTGPEAKFLNMGAWVADPKGKNVPRTSCFRRTEITKDQLYKWRHWGTEGQGHVQQEINSKVLENLFM